MPIRISVPTRRLAPTLLAALLALPLATRPAVAQSQSCFYADVTSARGPRFISDVFCVYGSVDSRDVMRSFALWARSRFSTDELAAWGHTRVESVVFSSQARAMRDRNATIASYQGLSGTPGWTYLPGTAQLAQGLADLSASLDVVLVDNGIGFSMGMDHGESNALTFGGSVRFAGRWRVHAYNPIESLSLGETGPDGEGVEYTERSGWGFEILRSFTPRIAVGVGLHPVRVLVRNTDLNGDPVLVSDRQTWDPTVSFTLPLGYLPLYFRYGQQSRFAFGLIVDFER